MFTFRKNLQLTLTILLLVGFLIFILFPVFYAFIYSGFSSYEETQANNAQLFPKKWQWQNYQVAFTSGYLLALGVSFGFAMLLVVLRLFTCGAAGYALARKELKFNKVVATLLTFLALIPENSLYLGLLVQVSDWNLNAGFFTFVGLAAPNIFSLFTILVFQDGFQSISASHKKLMRIDKLTVFQKTAIIWWPGLKHAILFTTIITTATAWNSYLWPMIMLPARQQTLSTFVFSIGSLADGSTSYSIKLAGVVLYTLPVIIFYLVFHRRIIKTFQRI